MVVVAVGVGVDVVVVLWQEVVQGTRPRRDGEGAPVPSRRAEGIVRVGV